MQEELTDELVAEITQQRRDSEVRQPQTEEEKRRAEAFIKKAEAYAKKMREEQGLDY